MAKQLLGKEVTAALNEKIIGQVAQLKEKGVSPKLGIIRVGERPDDISYETGATKRCDTLGVEVEKILLPEDVSKEELLEVIDKVNKDDSIHGVLMFRPLPAHLKAVQSEIENALDPAKDVDCMTHLSLAGVFEGKPLGFPPCTPQACMEILDYYGIDCKGKNAVVIGRSLVVGKPAAMMLMGKNATVTVCHTKTVDVPAIAREADILISCAEYLFFERFVKESLDTEISVSGIEGIPCRHIQFRALILPAGHFDFCNDTYRSIGDDTFRAGLHRSDVYCFLSIPTFQGTRTAAVKYPQHIIPESFG